MDASPRVATMRLRIRADSSLGPLEEEQAFAARATVTAKESETNEVSVCIGVAAFPEMQLSGAATVPTRR